LADGYSALDKVLHQVALQSYAMRNLTFDLEVSVSGADAARSLRRPHVFITGLARAGTTMLLRLLYSTQSFVTLSYRDMPFVLAPGLWGKLTRGHQHAQALSERAHGDGVQVGFDSPEAFEEVFWLTFTGDDYVRADRLLAYVVEDGVIERFRRYVDAIVQAKDEGRQHRYLSKNNNNLLRLDALSRAFPNADIVIPFRNPYDHAASLLQQHQRFCTMHRDDRFALRYMNWLGHFEFGANQRPLDFGAVATLAHAGAPTAIDYWIAYWTQVYSAVLERAPDAMLFLDFDALCERPDLVLKALATGLKLDHTALVQRAGEIGPAKHYAGAEAGNGALLARAADVYEALRSRAVGAALPRRSGK
jgi:hypothetical protein